MNKLTKQEAIEEHRKMWNWIADQTLKLKRAVYKEEYFRDHNISSPNRPRASCYCCEYVQQNISKMLFCEDLCPFIWGNDEDKTCSMYTEYGQWLFELRSLYPNYKLLAEMARNIANLPVREDKS